MTKINTYHGFLKENEETISLRIINDFASKGVEHIVGKHVVEQKKKNNEYVYLESPSRMEELIQDFDSKYDLSRNEARVELANGFPIMISNYDIKYKDRVISGFQQYFG